jgi:hypothetical protein
MLTSGILGAIDAFVLQRREERFRHRIIVADPGAADGLPEAVLLQRPGELAGRVVTAAIRMKNRTRIERIIAGGHLDSLLDKRSLIKWSAVCITHSWMSDFGSPLGANTGKGGPLGPRLARSRCCDIFLYGFKAARRAARAAATARTPTLPLALPLRRRPRRSAGAKNENPGPPLTYKVHPVQPRGFHAPAARLSEAGQNPSRPSVTAGKPDRQSCLVNVHP